MSPILVAAIVARNHRAESNGAHAYGAYSGGGMSCESCCDACLPFSMDRWEPPAIPKDQEALKAATTTASSSLKRTNFVAGAFYLGAFGCLIAAFVAVLPAFFLGTLGCVAAGAITLRRAEQVEKTLDVLEGAQEIER